MILSLVVDMSSGLFDKACNAEVFKNWFWPIVVGIVMIALSAAAITIFLCRDDYRRRNKYKKKFKTCRDNKKALRGEMIRASTYLAYIRIKEGADSTKPMAKDEVNSQEMLTDRNMDEYRKIVSNDVASFFNLNAANKQKMQKIPIVSTGTSKLFAYHFLS